MPAPTPPALLHGLWALPGAPLADGDLICDTSRETPDGLAPVYRLEVTRRGRNRTVYAGHLAGWRSRRRRRMAPPTR